ncbi:MAG: hypothetical protein Q4C95_00670 [Planctomycetia bacterium]|nr:hypothetical protein [Planctomycetia bacterium]
MKILIRNLSLIALGALLCWLLTTFREGLNAQPHFAVPNGNAYQFDSNNNIGLLSPIVNPQLANEQTTVSRPLEVPPVYAFGTMIDPNCLQLAVVDAPQKQIYVYWVQKEGNNSFIEFKTSRSFEFDFRVKEYNVRGLTPSQIRDEFERNQ